MQTFPKGLRALPLFSTHPFLPWTMPGTAGKGSTYGLHSMTDHCKERTQRGCGIVKDPLSAGVCNRSRVVSLYNIRHYAAPVCVLCLLTPAFQWDSNKCSRWPAIFHREIKKDKLPAFGMFVVRQFVSARCIMRFPINHHPEE